MKITKDNFINVAHVICAGVYRAEKYNSECFGMSDIRLSMAAVEFLDRFISQVAEAGYDPTAVLESIMNEQGFYVVSESSDLAFKSMLDDDFSIELDNYGSLYSYFEHVYQENVSYFETTNFQLGMLIEKETKEGKITVRVEQIKRGAEGVVFEGTQPDKEDSWIELKLTPHSWFIASQEIVSN